MTDRITAWRPNRRSVLMGGAALLATPAILRAQGSAITFGTLTPLTGVGGTYGPSMRDAAASVFAAVNDAGGLLGAQIDLVSEDTQTNPEAAVRAVRKLIDVDGVSVVIGTWASSITTAVAPLCWENGVMLFTVSGADSITQLPHMGYIARTQPNSILQIQVAGDFMLRQGASGMAWIGPQTPFAQSSIDILAGQADAAGIGMESLIYEADKSTYRSEVDTILRSDPNFIMLGGYAADSTVVLRDIWQSGYEGMIIGPAYAINPTVLDALPPEVTEGVFTWEGAPAIGSTAYANVQAALGVDVVDPYSAQTYDHATLAVLAAMAAGDATGAAIKDALRTISQGDGMEVSDALAGMETLAAGGSVNYSGASGPCDFDEIGDITGTQFLFNQISGGAPSMFERV
ncbi:MAG: ABC transporter substrate-binding protein [Pseudomonadota bacterium]